MSASGQVETIDEVGKDDESEISSTTSNNVGIKPSVGGNALSDSEAVPDNADSIAESSEPVKSSIPVNTIVDSTEDKSNVDSNNPSASDNPVVVDDVPNISDTLQSAELLKGVHKTMLNMEAKKDYLNDNDATSSEAVSTVTAQDNIVKEVDIEYPVTNISKEIAELVQVDADKDSSSLDEDLELRWEDDDEENDETTPTDDVLKMLDKELGIDDASENPQNYDQNKDKSSVEKLEYVPEINVDQNKTKNSINQLQFSNVKQSDNKDDKSQQSDKTNEDAKTQDQTDVVMTASDSFEESLKIIEKIDRLTKDSDQDIEMDKDMDTSSSETIEKPKLIDQIVSLKKEIPDPDNEMDANVLSGDTEKPNKTSKPVKIPAIQLGSALKADVDKMDSEISSEDMSKQELLPIIDNSSVSVVNINPDDIFLKEVDNIELEKEAVSLNKETIDNNEDMVQKVSDTATSNYSEIINKDVIDIEMDVSKVSKADNNQILTAADISSIDMNIVPAETSNISDNVKEVKNRQIINVLSEATIIPKLEAKKNSLRNDEKNKIDINDTEIIDDMQEIKDKIDEEIIQDADKNVSLLDDSILDTTITPNIHHRINQPNVMLDIPTQELSDIEAELDEFHSEFDESIEKTHDSPKRDTIVADSSNNDVIECLTEAKESEVSKTVTETNITSSKVETSTPKSNKTSSQTIQIDASASKSTQDLTSSLTPLHIDDEKPSSSKPNDSTLSKTFNENFDEKSKSKSDDSTTSSSKTFHENIVEKTKTSKSGHDDVHPSTSTEMLVDENPSTSKEMHEDLSKSKTGQDDVHLSTSMEMQGGKKSSTSKLGPDDAHPSTDIQVDENPTEREDNKKTSTSIQDDVQPSTSNIKQEICDDKPSTSEKLTPDSAEDIQEITDSLGLLAESSRVVDDENDDDDDPEADENDDDEDFDPYEESSSQMLEDMEESNTPPLELDPKDLDKPEPSLKVQESDEGTMDIADGAIEITDGTIDIVDDIECVEYELPELDLPDDTVSETPSTEEKGAKEDEPEIIDADEEKGTQSNKTHPPEKIYNILEKVLGQRLTDLSKQSSTLAPAGKVLNYVEVEGSSDSDDVLEVSKSDVSVDKDVISVNIPKGVEVMSTSGPRSTSEIVSKKGEVIISGVPKPPPQKMSKLNTSEVSIKTRSKTSFSIHIPEATSLVDKALKGEIFNLDSDEEEEKKDSPKSEEKVSDIKETPKPVERKCINPQCTNETSTYYQADRATVAYYSLNRRSGAVCEPCSQRARERSEALINGIKDMRSFLDLEMDAPSQQLVEISDSESDEEAGDDTDRIGEKAAEFLEENLVDMLNETWVKYQLESRLKETETLLMTELEKIEADAKELDAMLDECQKKTDAVRYDFYKDYEPRRKSLGAIIIHDTPFSSYSHTEKDLEEFGPEHSGTRYPKRRAASLAADTPAKKPAIPLGYAPLDGTKPEPGVSTDQSKTDDDKEDISVVKLSAESAPASLPPCGDIVRPPLKTGMVTYAMRNAFGTWLKGKIMEVQPKAAGQQFTQCRVKFEHKIKNPCKVLAARCLAYPEPCEVRMTIGTRVIALFKDPQNTARRESFYSGVVAEIPNPVNNYRYLVFFDDGYAQYVHHQDTRIVCESSSLVWEEVHPFIRDFICNYLLSYPERPMVRLHAGENLKTEWNGKWWDSRVLQVDASIALIHFHEDNRTEWIYRGSTRLAPLYLELKAAEKAGEGKTRSRLPRSKAQMRSNMPCVEYTRSDGQSTKPTADTQAQQQHNEELRRQRSVAKKSTTQSAQAPSVVQDTPIEGVISRVVYYTPKNAVKPYKLTLHTCTAKCKRTDLLSLKELRTYNPLAKPLLSGWERQTVRYKGNKEVMYRAPCGRRLRNMPELHKYLRILQSELSVDLFDFTEGTHCLAEYVLNKCIVGKKDLSHGKENVPVPCVNYYDDSLPEFCSYNTERTPTAGVPLNLDPDFLCGCDCTDDCVDKSKCACWKMTLEGARTIGIEGNNVGYVYRRLPEPLPSGIYECNSRCKCKQTCLNRVAQHPLQLKLQVFKTDDRGWGIRALNDIPKGSFVCVYAGNLLTDATANLDGLNEGDEYLAELDYIEVVEGMKEGYEDDIPDSDKKLDKKARPSESESEPSSESEDEKEQNAKDGDFQPGYIPHSNFTFSKHLRKREKAKKKEEKEKQKEEIKKGEDCITISDDEEVREPSRFTAQAGMVDKDLISKQSSRVSVRTLFGKDEACYIMDAKVQGNIGRYLNHSCHPNVFVQNVFVDTHDPRFPWVAFFALSLVRAGTELTWNYNYDIGSVPGKVLYCYCKASNCRGRLL